jgi:hypothetical protein
MAERTVRDGSSLIIRCQLINKQLLAIVARDARCMQQAA